MAKPRGTKLRTFIVSGIGPSAIPSRARPHKPPAKVISARKAAAMKIGGGKIPPKVRKRLEKEPLPARVHPTDRREKEKLGPTRGRRLAPTTLSRIPARAATRKRG
ncbi:MAG TPA: hypothetical protein VGS01_02015 [Candidatus Limnocylindria bacterium]|jgi:hypothetical protein|nr:hypothetical protein [Candidatus Limnocylindria bacterium]